MDVHLSLSLSLTNIIINFPRIPLQVHRYVYRRLETSFGVDSVMGHSASLIYRGPLDCKDDPNNELTRTMRM